MFIVDMQTVVTHVLSQHYFRCFPLIPKIMNASHNPDYQRLFRMTMAEWQSFLENQTRSFDGEMAWIEPLSYLGIGEMKRVSRVIFEFLQIIHDQGADYLLYYDKKFPSGLKQLRDPPAAISLFGQTDIFKRKQIAVIGSRKASADAIRVSADLGFKIAQSGDAVVSGGAYGCDIAAHRGALNSIQIPSPIVVVMASGLGCLYPSGHHATFRHIKEAGGIILSERLWGAQSRRFDFPIRNRLVSGLSEHIVVVEAGRISGAMITARQALDQGREVWVYGGMSKRCDIRACGNEWLISEGAPSFDSVDELLSSINEATLQMPDIAIGVAPNEVREQQSAIT